MGLLHKNSHYEILPYYTYKEQVMKFKFCFEFKLKLKYFFFKILFIFRERGEGREREHQNVVASGTPSAGDLARIPSRVLWLRIEPVTPWLVGWNWLPWATLARAKVEIFWIALNFVFVIHKTVINLGSENIKMISLQLQLCIILLPHHQSLLFFLLSVVTTGSEILVNSVLKKGFSLQF